MNIRFPLALRQIFWHSADVTSELLSTGEAAKILQVHPDTLVRWANEGKLPVIRISKQRRFRREDVEALLEPETKPAA